MERNVLSVLLGLPVVQMMESIEDKLKGNIYMIYNDYRRDHLPVGTGNLEINELFNMIKGKDLFITIEKRSVPHIKPHLYIPVNYSMPSCL